MTLISWSSCPKLRDSKIHSGKANVQIDTDYSYTWVAERRAFGRASSLYSDEFVGVDIQIENLATGCIYLLQVGLHLTSDLFTGPGAEITTPGMRSSTVNLVPGGQIFRRKEMWKGRGSTIWELNEVSFIPASYCNWYYKKDCDFLERHTLHLTKSSG